MSALARPMWKSTGPAEDIARISQCVVEKDIDQELTSSYSETLPIQFLDVDGNELDLKYVVSDVTEARVTIPILKKKRSFRFVWTSSMCRKASRSDS